MRTPGSIRPSCYLHGYPHHTAKSEPLCTAMAPKKSKPGSGPEEQRIVDLGHPECNPPFADNSIKTSRFTLLSFFPLVRVACSFSLLFVGDEYARRISIHPSFICISFLNQVIFFKFPSLLTTYSCPGYSGSVSKKWQHLFPLRRPPYVFGVLHPTVRHVSLATDDFGSSCACCVGVTFAGSLHRCQASPQ